MKRGNQMKIDLQISQETELEPIIEVASKLDRFGTVWEI